MPASKARQRPHFPQIDIVRGFAALTVLVYHLIAHWDWEAFSTSGPLAWFRAGWMAVDVFFVISGFVIGLSALARLDAQGGAFRAGFLRSRLARIAPLHCLVLLVFLLAIEPGLRGQDDFLANLGTHLLFVHNLFFDYHGAMNGPNWSLGTEMQFYLLVMLAAPWLARTPAWKILALGLAVAWAWRFGAHVSLGAPGPLDQAYMGQTQLPGMLDEFAIGLLLARFVRAPAGQSFLALVTHDARVRWGLAAGTALAWWALFGAYGEWDYWQEPAMAVFFRTPLALCAAASLLLACGWPAPKSRALLALPLYLGQVSYGIYLWHLPVLLLLARHAELEPLHALLVAVPATVGLAALTWHLVEQPLLRRWAGKPAPQAQPVEVGGPSRRSA